MITRSHLPRQRQDSPHNRIFALVTIIATAVAMITVVREGTAQAGPTALTPLFSIGTPDQSATEFALNPAGYEKYTATFPSDATYTVGTSTAADFPYIHPGPADAWAGSKQHAFTVHYTLTSAQAASNQLLLLSFVDANPTPPTFQVKVNGTVVDTAAAPPGQGVGAHGPVQLTGFLNKLNRPGKLGFVIPPSAQTSGANTLVITSTAGSWATYDAVEMLPAPLTTGPVQVLSVNPTVLFKKSGGTDAQVVDIGVKNTTAASGSVTFTASMAGGQTQTTTLTVPAGRSIQRILVPPAPGPGAGRLDVAAALNGQSATYPLNLPYQRRWQLDVMNGVHLDNGYHYNQAITRQIVDAYIDQAVAQCQATANYADHEKFRWTVEVGWIMHNYLQERSAAQIDALGKCVRSGQIEVTAAYSNQLTDLASTEQMVRSLDKGTRAFADKFGVPVTGAIQNDVTGVSGQFIQLLAQQGVKVLVNGTNPGHTGANNLKFDGQNVPTVFNWQAPDGSKVLTFFGMDGYFDLYWRISRNIQCALSARMDDCGRGSPTLPYVPKAPPADYTALTNELAAGVAGDLVGLQVAKYPQSVYPMLAFLDTVPPLNGFSDLLRKYNQEYSYPRIVMSTPSRYYADASTPRGATSPSGYTPDSTSKTMAELPVRSGDYTNWWSDGAGSSPVETGENMLAQLRTTNAETLGTLASVTKPDPNRNCLVESAYQNQQMWTEHTWGTEGLHYPSNQWPLKKQYGDKSNRFSQNAMDSATTALAAQISRSGTTPGVTVVNPLSWSRTDVVTATVPSGWAGRLVDATTGTAVAYQAIDATHIQFVAANVPAVGYRVYNLESSANTAGPPDAALSWNASTGVLENQYYKVTISTTTGIITSIVEKATGRQLVDSASSFKMNQYVYRPNAGRSNFAYGGAPSSAANQWSPSGATVAQQAAGPVSITIGVTYPNTPGGKDAAGKSTGVESGGSKITLRANTPRIEITNSINKSSTTAPEEIYYSFPFEVDNPKVTYEGLGAPVELGAGQMSGAAMDWQSTLSYSDVSNGTGGVRLMTPNAPLVEFGDIKTMKLISRPGRIDTPTAADPSSVLPANGSVFSWVYNNLWSTNYNAASPGPMSFDYAITSHNGGFDAVAATHDGWGSQAPLRAVALPASQAGIYPGTSQSLASVDAANVKLVTLKQASPNNPAAVYPMTARLLEVKGQAGTAQLTLPFKVKAAQLLDLTDRPSTSATLTVTDAGAGSKISVPYTGHRILSVGVQPVAAYDGGAPLACAGLFALAPNGHGSYATAFPNGVNYTVPRGELGGAGATYPADTTPWVNYTGAGIAAPQWSYIQPGPADPWGGNKSHTFSLSFDLARKPSSDLTLSLWLLDAHQTAPPKLGVKVNGGTAQERQLAAGGGDGYHWGDTGPNAWGGIKPRTETFTLPASQLVAGKNTVSITTLTGSWLVYDAIAVGGSAAGLARTAVMRGGDGALYTKSYDGKSWVNGFPRQDGPTGGTFTGTPAVTVAKGRTDVFVRGTDNALWQRTLANGAWSAWSSLGGTLTDSPSAAVDPLTGRVSVFMRGGDGALYSRTYDGQSWESTFQRLDGPTGGSFTGAPAVAVSRGRTDVFVRGTDNALWQRTLTSGTWSAWSSLGGNLSDSPAAAGDALTGHITVFVRAADGALYSKVYNGVSWTPSYTNLGGPTGAVISGAPAVASSNGRTDVFVRGTDNALWQRTLVNGVWSTWSSFGGYLTAAPSAAVDSFPAS